MAKEMEEAVDETMELIRGSEYLSTEVSRKQSIAFLQSVIERCATLAGEITHELLKHGEQM